MGKVDEVLDNLWFKELLTGKVYEELKSDLLKLVLECLPKELVFKPSRFPMYQENVSPHYCNGYQKSIEDTKQAIIKLFEE